MNFLSTRGSSPVSATRAILQGVAPDGGLYVPEKFPTVTGAELEEMLSMGFAERVAKVLSYYFGEFPYADLSAWLDTAFSAYGEDPAPLVRLDNGLYVLELFRGETCAYSDMTVKAFRCLLNASLQAEGAKDALVLVATAGNVGKSVLEEFKGVNGVKAMVVYPDDCVSKIQKLQLATQEGANVNVVALHSNFEGTLSCVKSIFSDEAKRSAFGDTTLVSANSFNIGALLPQVAFYFSAYCDLVTGSQIKSGDPVDFAIPVGNFGNAVAAYYAKLMGLPIRRIHCSCNENNATADFLQKGNFDSNRDFFETTSPSMDVLEADELERFLFEVSSRNAELTTQRVKSLQAEGKFALSPEEFKVSSSVFDGLSVDEEEMVEAVYDLFCDIGYTMDTHAGCAMRHCTWWREKNKKDTTPIVIVAPVSPYKCPQDVLYAVTGNDVKDSFKGIKRLHAATAMVVPKPLFAMRDVTARFTLTVKPDKLFDEVLKFAQSK